ncbi:MAG: response regulator, partial [Magnetococcales bacterium]|nr:response regulator [Magnetococcales bacterium]
AHKDLPLQLQQNCGKLPFGVCICGQAAAKNQIMVVTELDHRHTITYDQIKPHGHYCAPISRNEKLLGVLNLYLPHGYLQNPQDDEMLSGITGALAAIISQHLLHSQNEQARAAREIAEASNRAKSIFLANMSHELRTPMNGVLGMLDLLWNAELEPKWQKMIHTARHSAESLLTILNGILDFSRLDAKRVTLEQIDFDLQALLESVVALLTPQAQEKNIQLSLRLDPHHSPTVVRGDPTRLRQVLTNLLSNAIKFTEKGTVRLEYALESSTETGRTLHRFTFTDTGIGIPQHMHDQLFDAFTQADGSTTRRYGGTGLGLAICKELATLMDGEIGLESTLGRGSTFWFTCQLYPATQHPPPGEERHALEGEATVAALSVRFKGRVLLVEDSETNRHVGCGLLASLGITPQIAIHGAQALEMVRTHPFDLVLMDVQMPQMDGLDATRRIRTLEKAQGTPPIPIIAMTANVLPRDREACREAGMDDHLPKPVRLVALQTCLERWLPMDDAPPEHEPQGDSLPLASDDLSPEPSPNEQSTSLSTPEQPSTERRQDANQYPLLDHATLEELRQVMAVIEDGFKNLLYTYLQETPKHLETLERCGPQGDHDSFHRAAHSLKSNSGSLGAVRLAKLGQTLEQFGKTGCSHVAEVSAYLQQTRRAFEETEPLLSALLDHTPSD